MLQKCFVKPVLYLPETECLKRQQHKPSLKKISIVATGLEFAAKLCEEQQRREKELNYGYGDRHTNKPKNTENKRAILKRSGHIRVPAI
jgi:hypothetical protein